MRAQYANSRQQFTAFSPGSRPARRNPARSVLGKLYILLLLAAFLGGCRTRYDITLNNGVKITGVSKPVFDKARGEYRFKDPSGKESSVKAMRVRVIEPHGDSDDSKFNPPPAR